MSSHRELLGITALTSSGERRQVRSLGQEQAMPLLQQTSSGENMPLLKKGPWTAEEDALLLAYVNQHGDGNWNSVQKHSGVARCGKSCRLRWTNHLRPNLKKGSLSPEEERIVIEQHAALGNRWSRIATMLPGRTDNEIKNFWNTRKKRHLRAGWALYPPDVKPVTRSHAHQHGPEEFVPENGTTLTYIGGGDLMSSPDCSKSSLSKQVGTLGKATCPTFSGTMTRSDDLNPFSLTSPSCVPEHHVHEESLHGFKRTREEQSNLTMRNTMGWPIHGFSDNGLCLQARRLYNCNLASSEAVYQRFPFEPEPPDAKLNLSSRSVSLFAVSDHGASKQVAVPTSNHFSMARPDNYLQCLELELPSVQLAESADSSSTLSSPFSLSQTLHLSEVDSIGSSSNGSLQRNSGNLMDVLLQHHHGSSVDQGPAHAMDQLAMFTSSTKGAAASGSSWPENKDPLYFLGGGSLTLLNDELRPAEKSESSSANTGGNVESEQPALACAIVKTEYEVNGGPYTDEELVTLLTFERPAGLPIAESFLDKGLVWQMNNQGEEMVGQSGGLEAIFGHGVAFHLEELGAANGASSRWELGLCSSSWDSMPGAL